jgi:hypothetical protein
MKSYIIKLFSFPSSVNEVASRVVAGCVAALSLGAVFLAQPWIVILLAYGFWARVLTGPSLSPLAQLALRVVSPRITSHPRLVPGPPKRFAQGIGVVFSSLALLSYYGLGSMPLTWTLLILLGCAAFLEAAFAYCLGCKIFGFLMRHGFVPEKVCEECADLSSRYAGHAPMA